MNARTKAQKQALRQAYKLLIAHFEDVLIVCSMDEDNQQEGTDMDVYWTGGFNHANSLAHYAIHKLVHSRRPQNKPT